MIKLDLEVFSDRTLRILRDHCDEELKMRADRWSQMPPISFEEFELLKKERKVAAVKAYRKRVGCSLSEAKQKIDLYSRGV